ncbi:MAG: molybdopterin-dependent oxidoreductase [Chloroflexi bacterium]|nr:molybdopterin-dependent oxidoreductase [Chloroflexota bacterium]
MVSALALGLITAPSTALMQATPTVAGTPQPGPSAASFAPEVNVGGLVAQGRSFGLADLQALPQVTLPVVYGAAGKIESASYTGPRLLDVLQAAGGPTPPSGKNGQLRRYVLATGADGYQAVISWGELDPEFGADPVLVAWQRDGNALGEGEGMARLVVPGDKVGGRFVATLVSLEVRDGAAAPS